MDFKCNYCEAFFKDIDKAIHHIKKKHNIVENNDRIGCIVNFRKPDYCTRSYLTFGGLRKHIKSCVKIKHELDKTKVMHK